MHTGMLQQLWTTPTVDKLFDSCGIGFLVVDTEMQIIDVSSAVCNMLGYTHAELTKLTILDITHPDEVRVSAARHLRSVSGEHIPYFDKRYLHKSGATRWTRVRNEPVPDASGKARYWLAMLEDITVHKQEEIILEQMAAITEASDDAIFRSDLNRIIEFWGKGAERLYGYTAPEIIGQSVNVLLGGDNPHRMDSMVEKLNKGEATFDPSASGRHKDGHQIPISVMVFPIKDKAGKVIAFAASHRDISEMKAMEAQLLHAQRMETAGLLAGGVAHDFNNILTVILGSCAFLRDQLPTNGLADSQLNLIERAADKATRLTRQLLAFSSQQAVAPIRINPNDQLSEAMNMLKSTLGDDVKIITRLNSAGIIIIDPTQLEQLLLNLSINARHAMPSGGTLTIQTDDIEYSREPAFHEADVYCYLPALIKPGHYMVLTVSDSGRGIDKATLPHIFDPFFTTKDKGAGTGLGLSVVYGIIKQCGGGIRVMSKKDAGTEFQIFLPTVQGEADSQILEPPLKPSSGMGTIAVIEDNEDVLGLVVAILESAGYKTISYTNPKQLLTQPPAEDIDLIISDVVMPEMSGPAFAEIWLQHHPEACILFMSGYFDNHTFPSQVTERKLLLKPFKPSELLRQVQEILNPT